MYDLATDPDSALESWKSATSTWSAISANSVRHPAGCKAQPILHLLAELRQPPGRGRCERAGVVQPLLPARFRPGRAGSCTEPGVEQLHELRLPLRWIAILYGRVQTDFALTSGVHTAEDVIKAIMAGASVAMTTSELLHEGLKLAPVLLDGVQCLDGWSTNTISIQQMKGSMSQQAVADPSTFERANYMTVLSSY